MWRAVGRFAVGEVHLQHARPSYAALYVELLGAKPVFEQPHNAVLFDASALSLPVANGQ